MWLLSPFGKECDSSFEKSWNSLIRGWVEPSLVATMQTYYATIIFEDLSLVWLGGTAPKGDVKNSSMLLLTPFREGYGPLLKTQCVCETKFPW